MQNIMSCCISDLARMRTDTDKILSRRCMMICSFRMEIAVSRRMSSVAARRPHGADLRRRGAHGQPCVSDDLRSGDCRYWFTAQDLIDCRTKGTGSLRKI